MSDLITEGDLLINVQHPKNGDDQLICDDQLWIEAFLSLYNKVKSSKDYFLIKQSKKQFEYIETAGFCVK